MGGNKNLIMKMKNQLLLRFDMMAVDLFFK